MIRIKLWLIEATGEALVDIQVALFATNNRITTAFIAADTFVHNRVLALRRHRDTLRAM